MRIWYLISVLRNHCASTLCGFGIEHVQDVNVGGVVGRRRGHLTQGIDELVGVLIVHLDTNRFRTNQLCLMEDACKNAKRTKLVNSMRYI